MSEQHKYILTLACKDATGIVAAVSGFLAEHGGFIIESAQLGDASTGKFFMRTVITTQNEWLKNGQFAKEFQPIATRFSMEWKLYDDAVKPRVMVLVSKEGHCLNDLLHRYASGLLHAEIVAVVSNHKDLQTMATWYDLPFHHLPVTSDTRQEQEQKIWQLIQDLKVDVTVLARYMQVLTPWLVDKIHGQAINIHHSFLPGFKGARPYHQAFDRGVKIIGATAHYVSNELDEGPIIEQGVTRVDNAHTPEQFIALGRDVECMVLARALCYHVEHRVILNGKKTVVFK